MHNAKRDDRSFDERMDDEMRYHLEREVAERVEQGMTPDEAWRTARRDFGGVDRHKEEARDVFARRLLDDAARDASYAFRVLRRNPAFSAAVILTFALGIGCTSAIFSLVNGILLRPLPYAQPNQLVALWDRNDARKGGNNVVSVQEFEAWRTRARSFSGMAALIPAPLTLDGDPAERIRAAQVSPSYFGMLGVRPAIGRDFERADEANGGADVVILSDGFWRSHYGADRSIVGRVISIDGRPNTVIGVMPPAFDPPRYGWMADQPFWLPLAPTESNRSWGRVLHIVARLEPRVTIEQARSELATISSQIAAESPQHNAGWSATATPLVQEITGQVRRPLVVLFAAVALLMLMSAANVASLVTTFMRGRSHELAVRRAIGATPSRLLRQQLMQSALLGALGTICGLVLAYTGVHALIALAPSSVPRLAEVKLSGRVVTFAALIAGVTTIVAGLNAARRALRNRARTRTSGSRLIAAEIAIGLVLSVLAALMVRTLANLRAVDLGFQPMSVVAGRASLPGIKYDTDGKTGAFFDELMARARALPGVTTATLASPRPFACCGAATSVRDPSLTVPRETAPIADVRWVDEGFFSTLTIPVVRGATFTRDEPREGPVHVVVSKALARAVWGDADPIGKTVSLAVYGTTNATVIGVVGDVHLVGIRTPIRPAAYLSTRRYPSSERDIVLRGTGDPQSLISALRAAVAAIDPAIPLEAPTTLDASVSKTLAEDRFTTTLLAAFSALALVLAAIGVYGVLSGDVNRRRKEIGIRLALGARASGVTALVLSRALRPAVIGAAIGLIVALVLARSMSALVFGVGTWDPLSFGIVTVVLLAVAAIATAIPAFRATRVSPIEAIRLD